MAGKFCVALMHAKNDTDRATIAFVVANAAVASEKETMVFLSAEGVRMAVQGYAEDIKEEGFDPAKALMDKYVAAGGKIFVCSPCFKKRKLDETKLIKGATIVGGAKLVEFLGDNSPSICY